MKKLFIVTFILIIFSIPTFAGQNKNYYINKDSNFGLISLCFSAKRCYNATPEIIKVKDKTYVGFGGYHYYDISSYKHNVSTNTYYVDVAVDRDPSTDFGYYSKCPYNEGDITHLIFSLTYNPKKKYFKAVYKGFITTKLMIEYEKGLPVRSYFKYLNIYYDNNPSLIDELQNWLDYYNKDIIKTFGKKYGSIYDIEIMYILKNYIFQNRDLSMYLNGLTCCPFS